MGLLWMRLIGRVESRRQSGCGDACDGCAANEYFARLDFGDALVALAEAMARA